LARRRHQPTKAQIRNRQKTPHQRQPMLNVRAVRSFKYDLREILAGSQIDDEHVNTFIANLISKASRNSLQDGKDYVKEFAGEEGFSEETAAKVCRLLDRYKKWR